MCSYDPDRLRMICPHHGCVIEIDNVCPQCLKENPPPTTYPLRAQRVDNFESYGEENPPPGSYTFESTGKGLLYICPCGCGKMGFVGFRGKVTPPRPSWEWDGNEESPTLSPSIHDVGHWHGFLKQGQWTIA